MFWRKPYHWGFSTIGGSDIVRVHSGLGTPGSFGGRQAGYGLVGEGEQVRQFGRGGASMALRP